MKIATTPWAIMSAAWRWGIRPEIFLAGLIADHWGYALTFQLGALLSLVSVGLLWFLHAERTVHEERDKEGKR